MFETLLAQPSDVWNTALPLTPSPNSVIGSPYALSLSLTFLSSVGTAIRLIFFFRSNCSIKAAFCCLSLSSSEPPSSYVLSTAGGELGLES